MIAVPQYTADKLKILMDDKYLRIQMGRAGYEMMKQYAPEIIYDQWDKLLRQFFE